MSLGGKGVQDFTPLEKGRASNKLGNSFGVSGRYIDIAEYRLRVERKKGDWLKDNVRGFGETDRRIVVDSIDYKPTLLDIGITRDESSKAQRVANLEEIAEIVGIPRGTIANKIIEIEKILALLLKNPISEIPTKYEFLREKMEVLAEFKPQLYNYCWNCWNYSTTNNGKINKNKGKSIYFTRKSDFGNWCKIWVFKGKNGSFGRVQKLRIIYYYAQV